MQGVGNVSSTIRVTERERKSGMDREGCTSTINYRCMKMHASLTS